MKIKKTLLYILILCLSSCNSKKQNTNVEHTTNQEYTVITDSIYSQMPGSIFYQNGILYWQDVFSPESFVHAIDVNTKKELQSFGNIGSGPTEFTTPLLSLSPVSGLLINDAQKKLEILYQIDKKADSLFVSIKEYENRQEATRLLYLDNNDLIYLCPGKDNPFYIKFDDTEGVYKGQQPIKEKITNGFNVFQGNIAYNSQKGILVFSALRFPYLSVYKIENRDVKLETELKHPLEYTISDGELKLDKNVKEGAMELALTKSHIITLQRDELVEGEVPHAKQPRDLSVLPHSLFIYDYDLNLLKIINMPFPLLRLCGDIDSESIYAIAANPEFMIIKLDLGD